MPRLRHWIYRGLDFSTSPTRRSFDCASARPTAPPWPKELREAGPSASLGMTRMGHPGKVADAPLRMTNQREHLVGTTEVMPRHKPSEAGFGTTETSR